MDEKKKSPKESKSDREHEEGPERVQTDDLASRWKFCVFVFWKTLPRILCREVDPKMKKKEACILAVIHRDSLFCLDGGLAVCARVFRVCQSASLVKNLRVKFAGIFSISGGECHGGGVGCSGSRSQTRAACGDRLGM